MATSLSSFFKSFTSLILILLFHLGCFIFIARTSTHRSPNSSTNKKRKITPVSPSNPASSVSSSSLSPSSSRRLKPHKSLSSSWYYIKRIFSFKQQHHPKIINRDNNINHDISETQPSSSPMLASARTSQHSIVTPADITVLPPPTPSRNRRNGSFSDPDFSLIDHRSFPLRNDIFPCLTCGEIFQKPQLVEQHQSIKHAVTELNDGDSGKNIVRIIFKTGWNSKDQRQSNPTIHRILKIHNSSKILARFEEYRETVKSKEAKRNGGGRRRDERCIADGNELLRFHCSTCICNLGQDGKSSICTQQYCSVCGIIRSGFSSKMDGISTVSSSWRAHSAFPEELEKEFAFMNVKRVMLVCRVIAGRIGTEYHGMICDKDDGGFDSVIGGGGGGGQCRLNEEELLVFNPRAVLPCFAIIYSV